MGRGTLQYASLNPLKTHWLYCNKTALAFLRASFDTSSRNGRDVLPLAPFCKESAMKRLSSLLCSTLLCTALVGCAHDYHGPAVGGSLAVSSDGFYAGGLSVGTYYASPYVFPVLPPLWISPHRHYHPGFRPPPPPRHHGPVVRPLPHPRPAGPAFHHGPRPGHRPPAMRPGPHPGHRPPALRPGGPSGHRPPAVRPGRPAHRPPSMRPASPGFRPHAAPRGGMHRGGHGGPRPR